MVGCGFCVRAAKWLPVVFIVSVVSWSYYAYLVELCLLTVAFSNHDVASAIVLGLLYHLFLIPFMWAYWQTVWSSPGRVPRRYGLTGPEVDMVESASDPKGALDSFVVSKDLPVTMRSLQGEVRYCSECEHVKPDRCHHCSVCRQCVLKMDHHCPWVNNCVGFYNQKFFFLFLGYALLYCLYIVASTLKFFIVYWKEDFKASTPHSYGKFHVLFLFFVSAMFSVSLLSLFSYHVYLISQNRTTLEAFRSPIFARGGPNRRGFHLGSGNNFQEVFGDQKLLWILPIFSSFGDGLTFPRQGYAEDEEAGRPLIRTSASEDEMLPMMSTSPDTLWTEDDTTKDDDTSPDSGDLRIVTSTRQAATNSVEL